MVYRAVGHCWRGIADNRFYEIDRTMVSEKGNSAMTSMDYDLTILGGESGG